MKKVLFYTQNRWAFGSLHHALSKELYKYGVLSNLLDWTQPYTQEEFKLLDKTYDIFLTTPEAVMVLHNHANIPLDKIYAVAHGQQDLLLAQKDFGVDFFDKIGKYGVVSEILKKKSHEFKISRVPEVLTMGTQFDLFHQEPAKKLEKLGYAGARTTQNFFGTEIKRGHLVNETVQHLPYIRLIEHQFYHWMCMPAYYGQLDSLVISSTEESASLPFLEASCAGRLVFSTPVGYMREFGKESGYIELPLMEDDFRRELKNELIYHHINEDQFAVRCKRVQEYAREFFDWSFHIQKWVEFLT